MNTRSKFLDRHDPIKQVDQSLVLRGFQTLGELCLVLDGNTNTWSATPHWPAAP